MTLKNFLDVFKQGRLDIFNYNDYQGTVTKKEDGSMTKKFELESLNSFLDLEIKTISIKKDLNDVECYDPYLEIKFEN